MLKILQSEKVLCAFCKLPHRIYNKSDVSSIDLAMLLLVTGVFMFIIWGEPNNRSLIFFMSMAFCLQAFVRLRWRNSVRCPHCRFDPILYKRDPEEAALQVKEFLQVRKQNPEYLLKPRPQIQPRIKKVENWRESLMPVESKHSGSGPPEGASEIKTEGVIRP